MPIILPPFGLKAVSETTRFRDLGKEMREFAQSVSDTLASFNYNGADPTLVLSRVTSLEHERDALWEAINAIPRTEVDQSSMSVGGTSAGVTTTLYVPFPVGRFRRIPKVNLQHVGPPAVASATAIRPMAVSTSGFTISAWKSTTGASNITVDWTAVEATE